MVDGSGWTPKDSTTKTEGEGCLTKIQEFEEKKYVILAAFKIMVRYNNWSYQIRSYSGCILNVFDLHLIGDQMHVNQSQM